MSSATKEATPTVTFKSHSPKKKPLRGNEENHEILPTENKPTKSASLNSPVKMKLSYPNGKHFLKILPVSCSL